jgi:hypothetical protein
MPGLLSSTSRSRFATRSPSGPMYSLFFTPAPPLAPPPCAPPAAAPASDNSSSIASATFGAAPGRAYARAGRNGLTLLVLLPNLAHCLTHPPAGPPAAGPLPGRLFQLSTRDGTGRPPALVLLMVVPRRLFAAAAALDCMLLPSERAGCFRAQDGMRSSGFVPCTTDNLRSTCSPGEVTAVALGVAWIADNHWLLLQ